MVGMTGCRRLGVGTMEVKGNWRLCTEIQHEEERRFLDSLVAGYGSCLGTNLIQRAGTEK